MDITTPRLRLRPISAADAPALHEFRRRPEVMQWSMKKCPDKDLAETQAWLAKALSIPSHVFAVHEENTPRIIGTIGFRFMELPFHAPATNDAGADSLRRWELGYQFHPDVWGRGYATEATRAVLQAWMAGEMETGEKGELPAVHAATDRENEASQRVLVKAGFVQVDEFVDVMGTRCIGYTFAG
ncbi:GNAT domain-containing protein [Aspergillus ambiguus]|uniref:GNAT family N-acetyltransferase n=1 Tax=Aspergillus ambiguus TaxID=176160 RepID=UPI003CCE3867